MWQDWFEYDETSPSCLRWLVDIHSGRNQNNIHISAGDVAGSVDARGRWVVGLNYENYYIHRIIWELVKKESTDDLVVDHLDGDFSNNTISNLRVVTRKVNCRNTRMKSNNSTGVTGVQVCKNSYVASWYDNTKKHTKSFSILKYGQEEAFRLATEAREQGIHLLNENGFGYTERHGK